jgi:hypothetical protein
MDNFDEYGINSSPEQNYRPASNFGFIFEKLTKDMHFVGLFTIIYGVLSCLTIIGALFGIPIIIAGLRIREAADQFSIYRMSNNNQALKAGFELQNKYFRIFKILIIVGIVLTVLYILLIILFFFYGFSSLMNFNSFPQS